MVTESTTLEDTRECAFLGMVTESTTLEDARECAFLGMVTESTTLEDAKEKRYQPDNEWNLTERSGFLQAPRINTSNIKEMDYVTVLPRLILLY